MIHYSVLIPQRDAADAVARLVAPLASALEALLLPYEIIAIDDASSHDCVARMESLLTDYPRLRVLHFDQPRGTAAALTAGLAAARGDLVFGIDPHALHAPPYLAHLVARLSRHDLVVARRERSAAGALWARAARVPRLVTASAELAPDEEMLWAARRQAVAGMALPRGAFRLLDRLVARRGYRVCHLRLRDHQPPLGTNYRPGRFDRLAAGWLRRRFEPHLASEMVRIERQPTPAAARFDAARPRYVPQPVITPLENTSGQEASGGAGS